MTLSPDQWAALGGVNDAIHDNVAGEIAAITEKTTLVDADMILIEDSEDSNNKKRTPRASLVDGFDQIVFLASLDGSDLATTATDDSNTGHTITFNANAKLITAQKKFGTASADFDGTGDYLSIPNHADFDLASFDFTFEFWTRATAEPGANAAYIGKWDNSGDDSFLIQYNPTLNELGGFISTTGADSLVDCAFDFDTDGITVGQFFDSNWHHVAWVRTGGIFRMFVDGLVGSFQMVDHRKVFLNASTDLTIGARHGGTDEFTGQIDEIRIRRGKGLYTAPFTPPAVAFPRP